MTTPIHQAQDGARDPRIARRERAGVAGAGAAHPSLGIRPIAVPGLLADRRAGVDPTEGGRRSAAMSAIKDGRQPVADVLRRSASPPERSGRDPDAAAPLDPTRLRSLRRTAGPRTTAGQRTAGPRTAAGPGAAAGPRTTGAPVIRRALKADQVLAAVDSVGYLQGKLDAQTAGQQRAGAEKVRARVKTAIGSNAALFGADDAMSMALAIDAVAQVVAEELYDTSLKPAIARHLLETFRDEIKKAMPVKGRRTKDLAKATAIVSTDALGRYLHGERKLGDAAWDIRDEAVRAKMKPVDLFDLLSKKFQAQLASASLNSVTAEQDKKTGFNQSEITGSVSANYLKDLFGDAITTTPDAPMPVAASNDRLEFSTGAQRRLDDLRQAVIDTGNPGAADPRPKDATQRRQRLMADIREADTAVRTDRESQVEAALMAAPWSLSQSKARALIGKLKRKLPELPLTITHDPDKRLPADVAQEIDAVDRSRAGMLQDVDVAGRNFPSPGKWTGGGGRGDDYMRFRGWKDRMMTGNLGMAGDEMPVFGAVNPFFANTKGTGETVWSEYQKTRDLRVKGQKNWTDQDVKDANEAKKWRDKKFATNYYGTLHLVLKHKAVQGRVIYTASDHGVPHADPFLTFADFLLGSQGTYRADLTGLKRPGAGGFVDKSTQTPEKRNTEIVQPEYAAAIVAAIMGSKEAVSWTLPFEVQIHGGVDWTTDVAEIWVGNEAKDEVFNRLVAWSKAGSGRPKVRRATPSSSDKHISVVTDMAASGQRLARKV